MRILVWGLGYVGTVSAACLADAGHEVIGVEPNETKVNAINAGRTAVMEPGLAEIVANVVESGRLGATTDGTSAVASADLSLICVGTPSAADGSPVLTYIENVARNIGAGMRDTDRRHTVVLRSTVFPGATRGTLLPLLEKYSGKSAGADFGLSMNPEFLREASAVKDFREPPYTVIGQLDDQSGKDVATLYEPISAPMHFVALEEAEMLKLANNAFHALKIGFANEIGRVCDSADVDSHVVMDLVCADTKLNISPAYMRPGFAFGGSCLPKDLRSITFHARRGGVNVPILEGVLPSNRQQIAAARLKVHELGAKNVGILGLSFKAGTDDLRESPVIDLIRTLWQDGIDISVYDPDVNPEETLGSNREYLERQLPQIDRILRNDIEDVLAECDVVVVTQKRDAFREALQTTTHDVAVLDLVRLVDGREMKEATRYEGISW